MSGIGTVNFLSQNQIRDAFYKAGAEGKDFLVTVPYTSTGKPLFMPEFHLALDTVDLNEATHGIGKATAAEDFREIYKSYGNLDIESVYDLSLPFDRAAGGTNLLPQEALQSVLSEIEAIKQVTPPPSKPKKSWWKTVLGL